MPSMLTLPLEQVTEDELRELCRVLWSWSFCEECCNDKRCETANCPTPRMKRLGRFFEHYKDMTASYEPVTMFGECLALRTHEDLFEIIRQLRLDPDVTRTQLADKLFANRPGREPSPAADQERAINLAVRTMVMVNCSAQRQSPGLLEHGGYQIPWRNDVTFSQFIMNGFPTTDHPVLNEDSPSASLDMKKALTAKKLKKRAGLNFRPTDNLRNHLKLDRRNRVVEIYHHTAFLKEHLRITKDKSPNMVISDSLKLGALPRQLALETLDSIQKVLFPLSDPKSYSLLLSLTSTSYFDPDSLRFESTSIRNPEEKEIAYNYHGARLADLYEELENPSPRGWLEKWLERKSGARYVMMATLGGVAIAILLGIASLAVGIYQAWLNYQQWKHPVGQS